jgi:hypothetical protein
LLFALVALTLVNLLRSSKLPDTDSVGPLHARRTGARLALSLPILIRRVLQFLASSELSLFEFAMTGMSPWLQKCGAAVARIGHAFHGSSPHMNSPAAAPEWS